MRPSPDNAECVLRALRRFGAPTADLSDQDLVTPGLIFQIGIVPNRIDILTEIDGVTFDEAWASRLTARVEGQDVPVLGKAALLRNKRASGRKKDLLDASWLEEGDESE